MDVPATLTALGALVTAIGVVVIAFLNYRSKQALTREAVATRVAAAAAAAKAVEAAAMAAAEASSAKAVAAEAKAEIVIVGGELRELGKRVDGRLSQLLEKSEIANLAQGREEGIALEKHRQTTEDALIGKAIKHANGGKSAEPEQPS